MSEPNFDDADLQLDSTETVPGDEWDDFSEGFTVEVTAQEASSEAFGAYQPLPRGEYHVAITDVEMARSTSEKHNGEPYMKWEMTVQGQKDNKEASDFNPYAGRRVWANVMCFAGALYSITQAMKALGMHVAEGSLRIPPPEWWLGKEMLAVVVQKPAMGKNEETGKYNVPQMEEILINGKPTMKKVMRNEVSGFKPLSAGKGLNTGAVAKSGELTLQ